MSRLVPPLSSLVPDLPTYSFEQVARHCTPDDCWVIIHNHVYDVSKYLDKHPGGVNLVMKSAGMHPFLPHLLRIPHHNSLLEASGGDLPPLLCTVLIVRFD